MLLVLCHAVGYAVGKTLVTSTNKKICTPMSECNKKDRWYKEGKRVYGLHFKSPNLCFDKPSLSQSGSYNCDKSSSVDLVVVKMNRKPTAMNVNGHKIESALEVNENFELGCSFTYTKLVYTTQLPLKIRWNTGGFEENENIPIEKTEQNRNIVSTSVTITSRLNFSVKNAPSDALVSCQAIDEEGYVYGETSINVVKKTISSTSNVEIIPLELNPSKPNTSEWNSSDLNPSNVNLSESSPSKSNLFLSGPFQLNLLIILSAVLVVICVVGSILFVVHKRRRSRKNVRPPERPLEIVSVIVPDHILSRIKDIENISTHIVKSIV